MHPGCCRSRSYERIYIYIYIYIWCSRDTQRGKERWPNFFVWGFSESCHADGICICVQGVNILLTCNTVVSAYHIQIESAGTSSPNIHLKIFCFVYIYLFIFIYLYIYIYIFKWLALAAHLCGSDGSGGLVQGHLLMSYTHSGLLSTMHKDIDTKWKCFWRCKIHTISWRKEFTPQNPRRLPREFLEKGQDCLVKCMLIRNMQSPVHLTIDEPHNIYVLGWKQALLHWVRKRSLSKPKVMKNGKT